VANGVVYVGSGNDKLYAFSASCGSGGASCSPAWTAPTAAGIVGQPAIANGVVYAGTDNSDLYAFSASCGSGGASCSPLWTATPGSGATSSPVVVNGVVYVGSGDDSLYAYDLDPAHATARRTRPDPATLKPVRSLRVQPR
jgi:outer membrane protein assembly factor BamB